MSSPATTWPEMPGRWGGFALGLLLRPLQLGMAFPSVLYLATLAVFLFRPPDLYLYYADRVAFGVLLFVVLLRALALRQEFPFIPGLTLPMMGLVVLAVLRALRDPFDAQTWSLAASKFIVPFVLLHVAVLIFRDEPARKRFEIFIVLALAYLVFTAIAFLVDVRGLIFPRFILDESIGIHTDRARGPFLQAVANGVSLNMLGIVAIVLAAKGRKSVLLLWLALPVAILATMTRAVWIAFALSTVALIIRLAEPCLRRACIGITFVAISVGLVLSISGSSIVNSIRDRTAESGPVDARIAVYDAGWSMFREHPFTGWTADGMYAELARRMRGYHLRSFYIHNTYLSLLIEFGMPGLALYALLFFNLFRLGRGGRVEDPNLRALRKAWPILLCVYLFNAFFVDMAYQFVIGLLFTVAGMLYASKEARA